MKSLLLLALVLLPSISFADNIFDQYAGCYQTVSLNGKPVVTDDPIQTEISHDDSPYLDADTRTIMPAIKLFIYLGKFDDGHHMQMSYLPTDHGTTSSDENGDHYAFDGKVRFTTQIEKVFTLHIKVDFKKIAADQFAVTVFNKFDEVGNGATTSFVLAKAECSEE